MECDLRSGISGLPPNQRGADLCNWLTKEVWEVKSLGQRGTDWISQLNYALSRGPGFRPGTSYTRRTIHVGRWDLIAWQEQPGLIRYTLVDRRRSRPAPAPAPVPTPGPSEMPTTEPLPIRVADTIVKGVVVVIGAVVVAAITVFSPKLVGTGAPQYLVPVGLTDGVLIGEDDEETEPI